MRLTALDIKKKEFQQKMRGADPEEVQAFLSDVSQEIETLAKEKSDLEANLRSTAEKLEHYLGLESALERTLVAAQQTAMKMEEQAKREAELILRDAELEKSRRLADARLDQERLERDLARLRSEFESALTRMKSTVAGFTAYIASFEPVPESVLVPVSERVPELVPEPQPIAENAMPIASTVLPTPLPNGQLQWASTGPTPEAPPL